MFRKLFLFLLVLASFSYPEDAHDLFNKGNEFYKNKQFRDAVQVYEAVVKNGYESPSLYYNLGNSYYRLGKLGYAVLYYEKALKLAPNDEDIQHNLLLANARTIDRIETLPRFFLFQWWETLLALFSLKGWTYFVYIIYVLLIICTGIFLLIKRPGYQRYSFFSGLILLGILILSSTVLSVRLNREENIKNGIVVEQITTAKLEPDSKSSDAFVIHEGLKVKIEDKVSDWIKVRLPDGKIGWLMQKELRSI